MSVTRSRNNVPVVLMPDLTCLFRSVLKGFPLRSGTLLTQLSCANEFDKIFFGSFESLILSLLSIILLRYVGLSIF